MFLPLKARRKAPSARNSWLLICALLLAAAPAAAQTPEQVESVLNRIEWRNIGPAIMGGRIDDIAVVESDPKVFWVGTASAGVWKTTNHGVTWTPQFQNEEVSSIGSIAVAPSDPSVVWVGTGEPANRQSSSWGNGVYVSTDGGTTWTHKGLEDTHHIGRVLVHPTDPGTVYVAALGHLWGPNEERGVYRTRDGGETWDRVLSGDQNTGAVELAMDPESPDTLYAALYQRRRRAYGFAGGGPGSGIHRTTDGGDTWMKLGGGLPEGDTGRIGLNVYRRDPRVVYAIVENREGGVFRSEDKGLTWERMSDTNPRPMYYSQIRIDPNNDQRIWVLGTQMYYSQDGGRTFATDWVQRIHVDHHALWIDPADSNHMVLGNDGGIHISWDRGRSWDFVNTIALGQFYEIGHDMSTPYMVYGGLQDNGSWGAPSRTFFRQGISNEDWFRIGGGDGFYTEAIPGDPDTVYVESQNGNLRRLNRRTSETKLIRPQPENGGERYRFDWNSPIVISPHDPDTVYYGGNRLFISSNRGDAWTRTDDLTKRLDRDELPIMDIPVTEDTLSRHDGISSFGQIVTIAVSSLEEGVIYVGADDGNLQRSRDGGQTWDNLTGNLPGVPDQTYVTRLIASAHSASRVYVTLDGHRNDDYSTYAFVSDDYGDSFQSLAGTLPPEAALNVIREHHENENFLVTGGEFGVYVTLDRGANWPPDRGPDPHGAGGRPGDPPAGERPDPRYPRPQHLDRRRHRAAHHPRRFRVREGPPPLPGAGGRRLAHLHPQGEHRPQVLHRGEPAGGRPAPHLREGRRGGRDHGQRCGRWRGTHAQGRTQARAQPGELGSPLRLSGTGRRSGFRGAAARTAGVARQLHRSRRERGRLGRRIRRGVGGPPDPDSRGRPPRQP